MIEGLGDLIILVCIILLALVVWRIYRRLEQTIRYLGISHEALKELCERSLAQSSQPPKS